MSDDVSLNVNLKAAIGFDRAADAYERGRPGYPLALAHFLRDNFKIPASADILDLAAGTGKMTRLLCDELPARLIAVEPVEGMRRQFQTTCSDVEILEGTAEKIPLPDAEVDGVVVAQAFHWFDGDRALKEIHRVLRPNGWLAMAWNTRDEHTGWVLRLNQIMEAREAGTPRFKTMQWRKAFESTNLFTKLQEHDFPSEQILTPQTMIDRVCSVSFIAALPPEEQKKAADEVRQLIETHPDLRGKTEIRMPLITRLFWCHRI